MNLRAQRAMHDDSDRFECIPLTTSVLRLDIGCSTLYNLISQTNTKNAISNLLCIHESHFNLFYIIILARCDDVKRRMSTCHSKLVCTHLDSVHSAESTEPNDISLVLLLVFFLPKRKHDEL